MNKQHLTLGVLFLITLTYAIIVKQFDLYPKQEGAAKTEVILTSPTGKSLQIIAEIAADDDSRMIGLMNRRKLAKNTGMIFVWKDKGERRFWMKNTYIPLDMLFIEDSNIVGIIENASPHSLQSRYVKEKVNAVLEVNAGFAKKHEITNSWKVSYQFSDVIVQ